MGECLKFVLSQRLQDLFCDNEIHNNHYPMYVNLQFKMVRAVLMIFYFPPESRSSVKCLLKQSPAPTIGKNKFKMLKIRICKHVKLK